MHAVAVAGIVLDPSDRILLMRRRDHGHWEPPGGALKAGEDVKQGLAREIQEKTGARVWIQRLSGVYQNNTHCVLSLVFLCRGVTDAATSTQEASAVEWCTLTEAIDRLPDDYGQWMRDALRGRDVAIRTQHNTVNGASSSPHSSLD